MTGNRTPVLQVRHINKKLSGKEILKDVSLNVDTGELKMLIGPSGGGKSTLLQCINFLIPPDSGQVWLNGEEVHLHNRKDLYAFRAKVGMIFQDFNLFDHLTALDNVSIALRKVKKMNKNEARDRAAHELSRVGLSDKGRPLSGRTLRWAEATGFHRPGPGHGSFGHDAGRTPPRPWIRN